MHFTVPSFFRRLLQSWSLWSPVERTRETLEMCFERAFCRALLWCCPALRIALYVRLCSELDCGTGTSKEGCSIPWAAAAQRDMSNPQPASLTSGINSCMRKVVKAGSFTTWLRCDSSIKQVCGGAGAFSLLLEGSLVPSSGCFKSLILPQGLLKHCTDS